MAHDNNDLLLAGKRRAGLTPMASFARIKPLDVDKGGGVPSRTKLVSGWDEDEGTVSMLISGKPKVFDHLATTLPPESTQAHVYDVIAAPLVEKWLGGYDVDLLSYGQTGSGKTFTMFGPPHSMAEAAGRLNSSGGGSGISGDGIIREEHGFIIRAGFEALRAVSELEAQGCKVILHGSMVEITIMSLTDQTASDLLNNLAPCYIDSEHHLQGALQMPLTTAADVVNMAAAVETRLVRGT